jgi:RNA polymerase sigma-70 factor (ECF subfamily)
MGALAASLERAFGEHRPFLWSLCYRLCGDAADADDLVQETFVRALEKPPVRTDEPWRPWLVRVAINLGRDLLRRRKRQGYEGPWLPAPVEVPASDEEVGPGARYERLESVSLAFLVALEALSPAQRAVLILRDVFDYSVRETARVLGMTEANVKTTHLRARRRMARYDRHRVRPAAELQERTLRALELFLASLQKGDAAEVEGLLAEGVSTITDAGDEFVAARRVVAGRARVAALYLGLTARMQGAETRLGVVNGLPAVVARFTGVPRGWAPRAVVQVELDERGLIRRIYAVLASRKLARVQQGA